MCTTPRAFPPVPGVYKTNASDSEDQWQYSGAIYLWGADLGGRTLAGSEVEVGFSDLVDNLETGFMGAFEVRKNDWSLLTDIIYLDIGANKTADLSVPVGPIQVPVTTATNLGLQGLIWPNASEILAEAAADAGLPGDGGRGTPWCAVAGRFEAGGRKLLAGLVCRAASGNGLGQFVVQHQGQWLDTVRVQS